MKRSPGHSGVRPDIRTSTGWVEATNVIQIGSAVTSTPSDSTRCDSTVSQGRFSTMRALPQ